MSNERLGVIITLGLLSWNTSQITCASALELAREATRLRELGAEVYIYIVDNGSTDGTVAALFEQMAVRTDVSWARFNVLPRAENSGMSVARNHMLRFASDVRSEFLLLLDGDIEIVPYSVYHMVRYLKCHIDVGCIGAYPANCTAERSETPPVLTEIPESRIRTDIRCAFTQYGVFRMKALEGIKFEVRGPFGEPGWGLEDDDLFYQMYVSGWKTVYFSGMTYLHRNLHSSWTDLGMDLVHTRFAERKQFFLDKWGGDSRLDPGIINLVRAQSVPDGK